MRETFILNKYNKPPSLPRKLLVAQIMLLSPAGFLAGMHKSQMVVLLCIPWLSSDLCHLLRGQSLCHCHPNRGSPHLSENISLYHPVLRISDCYVAFPTLPGQALTACISVQWSTQAFSFLSLVRGGYWEEQIHRRCYLDNSVTNNQQDRAESKVTQSLPES